MPNPAETRNTIHRLLSLVPHGRLAKKNRYELFEDFRRPALLNASLGVASNLDFEMLPSVALEAIDADQVLSALGGFRMQSRAAPTAVDGAQLIPHQDAKQSGWATAGLFATGKEPHMEARVSVPLLTTIGVRVGFVSSNAIQDVTDLTAPVDSAFFSFITGEAQTWKAVTVDAAGVPTSVDTGIAITADVDDLLAIEISADRHPRFIINGSLRHTGAAMTDAVDLFPQVGVTVAAGAANRAAIDIRHLRASRNA